MAAVFVVIRLAEDGGRPGAGPASIFSCRDEAARLEEIPLRLETIVLAADSRRFAPCPGEDRAPSDRDRREMALIERATRAEDPVLARAAYVTLGRIGVGPAEPEPAGDAPATLEEPVLDVYARGVAHADPRVRQAAVVALGDALDGATREPVSRHGLLAAREDAEARSGRFAEGAADAARLLTGRLDVESDPDVAAAILETLGRLPSGSDAEREAVEALLAGRLEAGGPPLVRFGAAKGLEFFVRRSPGAVSARTIRALRATASPPIDEDEAADVEADLTPDLELAARTRRLAMLALAAARDTDADTLAAALRDEDWQVRRLAVARLSPAVSSYAAAIDTALADPVLHVRLEAVRVAGRAIARTSRCGPLVAAIDDAEIPVTLASLDALPSGCREEAELVPQLERLAALLSAARDHWHVPARAAVALARIAPDRARPLLETAASHPVWQVRAAAAEVARLLDDEAVAVRLARDEEPNVRTSALGALARMQSPARFDAALEGLRSGDYDLIRTSAGMLDDPPDRAAAVAALLERLRSLTDEAADTSRDPRAAIIRRLGALMTAAQAHELLPFVGDFDPRVGVAALDAYRALAGEAGDAADAGAAVAPGGEDDQRARYPYQPSVEALAALPRAATLQLEDGAIVEIELFVDVAPVMVARFAELARAGHYDGLTFHRVAPNFVIQGGSPGANEYSGVDRYVRDELGASNWRGTVGLSTRGRDTGDAQFYVNLVDNPRLDHEYTVFGRVTSSMDALDRVLEGAVIVKVSLA
jgi:cyclophilin family peptidyl-prolyl cis-trans isomerase/HEAT repeat protein